MAKRSIYTKQLGRAVARDAKHPMSGIYHVVSAQSEKWSVVSDGTVKPIRSFATRNAAVSFAKKYASINSSGEVIVHGRDGKVNKRMPV
jgi:hypothetical protein